MSIKDIVNRDIVNLTNCDQEPIHIPGSIQPHGFLIGFRKNTLIIDYCSGNIDQFIGIIKEQVISKRLEQVVGTENEIKILDHIHKQEASFSSPLTLSVNKVNFNVSIHASAENSIAEFEMASSEVLEPESYYNQTRRFVAYMSRSVSLQSLCHAIAEETRSITGYDRVMIYRFDKDYNGEVFAESKRDDIESFLGIHYPHTDIPTQARELYKKNLLRLIVDVNYVPVPIYTLNDAPDKNLDLSNTLLRSVSPIHVQYLHNIGVGATLTISLMLDNNLWGLIACHHYSPKYITSFTRVAAQLQGHFLTSQIRVREVAEQHELSKSITSSLEKMLLKTTLSNHEALTQIVKEPEILTLCNANGVAVVCDERIFTGGHVPSNSAIQKLVHALRQISPSAQIVSSKLSDLYPDVDISDTAAGILYYPFSSHHDYSIIWFRGETIQEVNWGGDPSKAFVRDEKGLSPRKSFELWKEEVRFQSKEWTDAELFSAATFAQSIERHLHLLFITEEESKFRLLSEKLKRTNSELENVNWIGTHDLKEPLRKIQVFASLLLSRKEQKLPEDVVNLINRMNISASRMQVLISDILSYSKLITNDSVPQIINLGDTAREVIVDLEDEIAEKNGYVQVEVLPEIEGINFLIHQLFTNLISNSLKFARENVPAVITISSSLESGSVNGFVNQDFYRITMKDNGIGFQNEFKESIFNVFTRLHSQTEYRGSGIGLALCKKIMENHKGFIRASGEEGIGSEFSLYFPKRLK